ncbi:MAG: GlxA family transcriptional regulator [Proteobacteria bacterium]|nr:GlxA family transcriptional regulator [Pseudomonadota bacterium]
MPKSVAPGPRTPSGPRRFTFLLMPEFSMIAFTSAIEPLRVANRMSGQLLYHWRTASLTGAAVTASNGVAVQVDGPAAAGNEDALVICAGLNPARYDSPALGAALRRALRGGAVLGAVCTGSVLLARARLLDGYRCTIHWEDLDSFAENFPQLDVSRRLFEVDRDRFTCSGGTAPLDLMMHFIARDCGRDLAVTVAEQMLHPHTREGAAPQRLSLPERTGVHHAGLLAALEAMEANLEVPLTPAEVAAHAGLSLRQLERLFHQHLHATPARHYLTLRLTRARHLARQTALPLLQIAVATGFASAAHFARAYRQHFGLPPSADRQGH